MILNLIPDGIAETFTIFLQSTVQYKA